MRRLNSQSGLERATFSDAGSVASTPESVVAVPACISSKPLISLRWYATSDAESLAEVRSQPRLNAAESTGSPFENVCPGLRVNVHAVQSAFGSHFEATPSYTSPLGLTLTSPVNSALLTRMPSDSWALYGSIAVGSVMPSRNVPPGLPATGGRSWVSGKPTEAWLPPFDPVLDFWLHPREDHPDHRAERYGRKGRPRSPHRLHASLLTLPVRGFTAAPGRGTPPEHAMFGRPAFPPGRRKRVLPRHGRTHDRDQRVTGR